VSLGSALLIECADDADAKAENLPIIRHRVEDLSDEHINQTRRFLGLPPLTAAEAHRLRGLLPLDAGPVCS
jgi:hypothetical protein